MTVNRCSITKGSNKNMVGNRTSNKASDKNAE